MSGALSYLITQTVRNRIGRQAGRVRNPRYAIAMLLGIAYFVFIFASPFTRDRAATPSPIGAAGSGPAAVATFLSLVLALFAALWWLKGGVFGALAFQPAEVHFLFPAPLTRRALIAYKIARSQLLILLNAVFWTLLLRRWGLSLAAPLRFVTAWAFFTLISLHRLTVALVQTPPVQGPRRIAAMALRVAAVVLLIEIGTGLAPVVRMVASAGFGAAVPVPAIALSTPPASIVLFPFHLMTAPLAASTLTQWAVAVGAIVGLIAVHLAVVLSLNVEFEEVAAKASADLARRIATFRHRAAGGAAVMRPKRVKRDWLPLSPRGVPWLAVAWKNTLALTRTAGVRTAVVLVAMLVFFSTTFSATAREDATALVALTPILIVLGFTVFMGPRMLRNDLLVLPLRKTWPLSGFEVVLSEMASPAIVLTVVQVAMMFVGALLVPRSIRAEVPLLPAIGLAVVAPLLFAAINTATIVIQNGMALLFPSWVRLGTDSGGVEALGQNLLATIGSMLALLVALIPPAIAVGIVLPLARPLIGHFTIVAAVAVAAGVLIAEVAWMLTVLGRAFEKTEASALA
jgi:hypothetical protein